MDVSADDYRRLLQQLLPVGPAWSGEPGMLMVRVLDALARSYYVAHVEAQRLHAEADPRTASLMLADWERNFGLPDPCMEPPVSVAEQRARLVQKVVWTGGQSLAAFIAFLESVGYPGSTITEFRPFRANSKCNAPLNQGGWRFAWRVNVPATADVRRMNCLSRCDEPLASWGDPGLHCMLAQHKPAHTVLFISYGESP